MSVTEENEEPHVAPPSATGPAGSLLEGKVGGYYLLSLVAGGEPRGLPGATISSVGFQQAVDGFTLDDIVVHAINADGSGAILEIQSKRELTFTASDKEFAAVVGQMWLASKKEEFFKTRYELAVAIGKTTTRIENDCQEVLFWARELPDGATFAAHIRRPGFSSKGMRGFVEVFKANLKAAGAPDDDQFVWSLLRRFQILVFDFQSHGSEHSHFARERCRSVLASDQSSRSSDLWALLSNAAMQSASAAGGKDQSLLKKWLGEQHGYTFGTPANLRPMQARLKAEAKSALDDIKHTVGNVRLSRASYVDSGLAALAEQKALAIVGAAGTGKSAVLKHLAQLREVEGTVIFLSRGRIVPGGGNTWAQSVTCPLLLDDLVVELGSGGGTTLFIDNIDQIDDPDRISTVNDLLRAALGCSGWRVAFTAADTRQEWVSRFPALAAQQLASVVVGEINDAEVTQLLGVNAALFAILDPSHPARGLARNLFFLSRLLDLSGDLTSIAKEVDLAVVWWRYGGGRSETNRVARQRLLRTMAAQIVKVPKTSSTRADELDSATVEELLSLDTLQEHQPNFSVAFRHDVLRDWTIGFLIQNEPSLLDTLPVAASIPEPLARAIEFAARLALASDDTGNNWLALLKRFEGAGCHGSWRRPVLLALTRSENALQLLQRLKAPLIADNGKLLIELLKLMQSMETRPLKELVEIAQPEVAIPEAAASVMMPTGAGWFWLVSWITTNAADLPFAAIPDAARLLETWLIATQAQPSALHSRAMKVLFEWLTRCDQSLNQTVVRSFDEIKDPDFTFPQMREVRDDMRMTFFACSALAPALADQYLRSLDPDTIRHHEAQKIICYPGSLPKAAPSALADFALASLIEKVDEDDHYRSQHSDYGPFISHESELSPASPGQGPFLELLLNSPADGLRLVRGIVAHATEWWRAKYDHAKRDYPRLTIPFPDGPRQFTGNGQVYGWSRSEAPSSVTTSALMALEAWGHHEIERGRPFPDVLAEVIGDDGSSIAFLSVAVDLVLSHWGKSHPSSWPFLASPELLRYDDWRSQHDMLESNRQRLQFKQEGASWKVKRADLEARSSRQHRLWECVGEFSLNGPKPEGEAMRSTLAAANTRIQALNNENDDPVDGLKACAKRALRLSDPANWKPVQVQLEDGTTADRLLFQQDAEETELREARAKVAQVNIQNTLSRVAIQKALLDSSTSTPETLQAAIQWATAKTDAPVVASAEDEDSDEKFDRSWDARAVVMAAALIARDYDGDDASIQSWAKSVLEKDSQTESTEYFRNPQIEYNAQAIAVVGLLHLYKKTPTLDHRQQLLKLARNRDPAVRNAIGSQFADLLKVAPNFLKALIRVSLTSAAFVRDNERDSEECHKAELEAKIAGRIAAEKVWLETGGNEPDWPDLPEWRTRKRRGIRIGGARTKEPEEVPVIVNADERALGSLVQHFVPLTTGDVPSWLTELTGKLMGWSIAANGPHGANDPETEHRPSEWNSEFFDFLGVLSVALPHEEVLVRFVRPMCAFNDEALFDCADAYLRGFDRATFATDTRKSDNPSAIRAPIAQRIQKCRSFRRLGTEKSFTSEYHLADLVSAFFYHRTNLQLSNRPSFPTDWKGITDTIDLLSGLVVAAPASGYLATAFLNVLENAKLPGLLPHLSKALGAWCSVYGDSPSFWVERDIGPRVCNWLDKVLTANAAAGADAPQELIVALDTMIKAGIAQARQIEQRIASFNDSKAS